MNNRTRQWFKACEMLDKHDPCVMAFLKNSDSENENNFGYLCLIRKSQLEAAKEEYGDRLEVWG